MKNFKIIELLFKILIITPNLFSHRSVLSPEITETAAKVGKIGCFWWFFVLYFPVCYLLFILYV